MWFRQEKSARYSKQQKGIHALYQRSVICMSILSFAACFLLALVLIQAPVSPVHAQGESITVQITGATQPPGFSPAFLTIHLYDTVIFINQSVPAATYAILAQDGSFASPAIAHSEQWATTVNTTGPHPYSISSSATMFGEIFVVANTVSLLPTPIPQAQATANAALATGKSPPDSIVPPTTASTIAQGGPGQIASPFNALLTLVVILNSLLTVGMLIAFSTWLLMRRKAAKEGSPSALHSQSEQRAAGLAGFLQRTTRKTKRRFFWQRRDDDEEWEIDDDEE